MYNKVILAGFLTRNIDLRYTPNTGMAVASTGIATNRKYKSQNGEEKEEKLFIDVTIFGRSAEIANQFLKKGSKVFIEGRLVFDQWIDAQGQKRSKHSVVAEKVLFLDSLKEKNIQEETQSNSTTTTNTKQKDIPDIDEEEIPF
jgi:single-strand DNA-binding protein